MIIKIEDFAEPSCSVLRQVQPWVEFPLSSHDQMLIKRLKKQCFALGGVGLAAPQIGASRHIAVIYIPASASLLRDNAEPYEMHTIINGFYEPLEQDTPRMSDDFEACYSVKSTMAKIKRYNNIIIKYHNEEGDFINTTASGFYARVLQHEIDHCNGGLFIDKIDHTCLHGSIPDMIALRRQLLASDKKILLDNLIKEKKLTQS